MGCKEEFSVANLPVWTDSRWMDIDIDLIILDGLYRRIDINIGAASLIRKDVML